MHNSVYDKISKDVARVKRQLEDLNIKLLGTKLQVLRITVSEKDSIGDFTETLNSGVINNAIISHPLGNNVMLFNSLSESNTSDTYAIDLWEVLTFTMKVLFEGNFVDDITAIKEGDLIIDVLFDEQGSKIPVIFRVTRSYGGFFNKYLTSKKFQLALERAPLEDEIQSAVDLYINTLVY